MKDSRTKEEALHAFLSIEEQMYRCQDGCTSCAEHSPALERAHLQALRAVGSPNVDVGPTLHSERLTSPELADALEAWANIRDQVARHRTNRNWAFQPEHSEMLRVAARRLRVLAIGCVHPTGSLGRSIIQVHDTTHTRDLCLQCGAVVAVTAQQTPPLSSGAMEAATRRQTQLPMTPTLTEGGSRADSPLLREEADTPCANHAVHREHDYKTNRHCPGWAPRREIRPEDDQGGTQRMETILGYDDANSGGPMPKIAGEENQSIALVLREGGTAEWLEAHAGIANAEMHTHPSKTQDGPAYDCGEVTHSHWVQRDRAEW
ncbi:hypothetical protein LCGC14_1592220 [marine sediment metagenome]|uniref:Uncharacterized protein n=1 Tax=marine sediment metagenome TaxID=412755 RepID=A0A0F9IE38_9ZZZZ